MSQMDELMLKELQKHDINHESTELVWFREGWNAAIKVLEQAAGEFDEKATRKACKALNAIRRDAWVNGVGSAPVQELAFLKGARWQHSQDAARIGLAEKKLFERHEEMGRLEARLAESRTYCLDQERQLESVVADVGRKLTAAEARVKELEDDYEYLWKMRVQDEKERQRRS